MEKKKARKDKLVITSKKKTHALKNRGYKTAKKKKRQKKTKSHKYNNTYSVCIGKKRCGNRIQGRKKERNKKNGRDKEKNDELLA